MSMYPSPEHRIDELRERERQLRRSVERRRRLKRPCPTPRNPGPQT
jgi:hypothetical protein